MTFDIHARLSQIGLTLPKAAAAAANYIPYTISGDHLYIAGQIPFLNGEKMHMGCVGRDVTAEQAVIAAQACGLNILAQVDAAVDGDWSRVKRCLKLGGFVHCTPDFMAHPLVINGASDLMVSVLGEAGKHVRFAVGAPCLPLNAAVEIEAIFALN